MRIISLIFDAITDILAGFLTIVQTLFSDDGILAVIYTTEDGFQLLGVPLLLPFGFYLVKWGLNFVFRLLRLGQ